MNKAVRYLQRKIEDKVKLFSHDREQAFEYVRGRTKKGWLNNRNLDRYNSSFEDLIPGISFYDILENLKRSNRVVDVYEEGMGQGSALRGIKEFLGENSNVTGSDILYQTDQIIDGVRVIGKPSEEIVLSRPQDLIISHMAGLQFTIEPIKKLLFLKLLYSLKPKGIMFLRVNLTYEAEHTYKYLDDTNQILGIKRALEKRGFKVYLKSSKDHTDGNFGLAIIRP